MVGEVWALWWASTACLSSPVSAAAVQDHSHPHKLRLAGPGSVLGHHQVLLLLRVTPLLLLVVAAPQQQQQQQQQQVVVVVQGLLVCWVVPVV